MTAGECLLSTLSRHSVIGLEDAARANPCVVQTFAGLAQRRAERDQRRRHKERRSHHSRPSKASARPSHPPLQEANRRTDQTTNWFGRRTPATGDLRRLRETLRRNLTPTRGWPGKDRIDLLRRSHWRASSNGSEQASTGPRQAPPQLEHCDEPIELNARRRCQHSVSRRAANESATSFPPRLLAASSRPVVHQRDTSSKHFRMTSCERSRRAPVCPLSTLSGISKRQPSG